ncbi:hypothetical protein, partial [Escherichia coli]|uniref:hypothetical protein n=1 Tax=Escherichia coli TaxID=562 RepID=UPI001BC85FBB
KEEEGGKSRRSRRERTKGGDERSGEGNEVKRGVTEGIKDEGGVESVNMWGGEREKERERGRGEEKKREEGGGEREGRGGGGGRRRRGKEGRKGGEGRRGKGRERGGGGWGGSTGRENVRCLMSHTPW